MQYTNPEIPEGINTSKEHPLKEFLWLTGGVLFIFVVVVVALVFLTDIVTKHIPFSVEKNISLPVNKSEVKNGPLHTYLQSMADRVARAENLPADMMITIHYVDGDTVNAFATLGGNVILFRGLLEKLDNENSLAMLLAHEIAHVKYRHPIRSAGRGVVVGLALSVVSASAGDAILDRFLGNAGYITILQYSRSMESQADEEASQAVLAMYGTLNGSDDLFKVLQKETGDKQPPVFFSTHPLTASRIARIESYEKDHPEDQKAATPLPPGFSKWVLPAKNSLESSSKDCPKNESTKSKVASCD